MVNSRGGTFTPSHAQQTTINTGIGISHSPHGSHTFSAGASPSTSSPSTNPLTKIVVAQVYLLLSTIKEDKDRTKWEQQAEHIRGLLNEHGMEVYQKFFSRLVVGNASTIFPGHNRPVSNPSNYKLLSDELKKVSKEPEQAGKIADAIETANEDIFRDFDLSTFMDHFKLDALEKTILALAFKPGSRSDLKTKADAIISANHQNFLLMLSGHLPKAEDFPNTFLAAIIDRLIQEGPPNLEDGLQKDLQIALGYRFRDSTPSPAVYSSVYLLTLLDDKYPLVLQMQSIGARYTSSEASCRDYLQSLGQDALKEDQVGAALLYAAISHSPSFSPAILVAALQKLVSPKYAWHSVVASFDQPELRITSEQFLSLYEALRPVAEEGNLDIQQMWGGDWENTETQLSFLGAFASLSPEQLDATTIPGLETSFTLEDFADADAEVQNRAAEAVRHPLVSYVALLAMFNVALKTPTASDTPEAKRLFQDVVVPNLDIFLVSSSAVPKPWSELASDTMQNLFDRFLHKYDPNYNFVLEGLWRKDRMYVKQQLIELHAKSPLDLPTILDHALKHEWLDELVKSLLNGFALDLAALAHGRGVLDLQQWAQSYSAHRKELAQSLLTFLSIKAQHEMEYQRQGELRSVMLPVKTISALLVILESIMPKPPSRDLIAVQRSCITVYPRLINHGQGFDDIIDLNGRETNQLPASANEQMEQHYKSMYSDELQVRQVVERLNEYKHSRDPVDQDVFSCMIHGLFDEYSLYSTYPLEALATTAVLFGGIISHKLISDLPLEIGLGMILEAVRDHSQDQSMYKFGLQALMQLFTRLREWPVFCKQLLQIPQLQGTEAWNKAEEVVRDHQEELARNGHEDHQSMNGFSNGSINDLALAEPSAPPFSSLNVDPSPSDYHEEPSGKVQDTVQFVLNNITEENVEVKFDELKAVIDQDNQAWFAGHLVEERAKMQPNYHALYLNLVRLFESKSMWAEVLRETYISAIRCLNSPSTMKSPVERTHLKNLGVWLGSLTLARDKPIKHRNIAFKQLLLEAYDTHRLIVVIPFVCKVLAQGKYSTIFKPFNPWVMDIIQLLMELYHRAELKLNQRFEIEVLCGELDLDHKSIEPSNDLNNRVVPMEESGEVLAPEIMDRFDNMSMNGIGGVGNGRFSPQEIVSSIPDLGPLLQYPPSNEMVNQVRLQEIVRTAVTRAVHEIISPVVERSVTIAAISTAQMIHKDFATEPDEERVRLAAINMVKKTAGSLALVTSKEPLRASMTNYIRALAQDLPQSLPEGTIIMCVNANLEVACNQVEKKAEERAVPEIEEMIEGELEARRLHRMTRPDDPYFDPSLSRWSWTIPAPYKLQPTVNGLNRDQMSIYDEFAKQAPPLILAGPSHMASQSDASRSMANDVLQEYPSVPSLPTPAEPPAMPQLNQQPAYAPPNAALVSGRHSQVIDPRALMERVNRILAELQRVASEAPENHYNELPRPHSALDAVDSLTQMIIRCTNVSDAYDIFIIDQICSTLFSGLEDNLTVECLVQSLENIYGLGVRTANRVSMNIAHIDHEKLLSLPLALALVRAEMIDWQRIDSAFAKALGAHKDGSLEAFASLADTVLLNDRPSALFADFAKSLELAWQWIDEDPTWDVGKNFREKLTNSGGLPPSDRNPDEKIVARQAQMEYVFQEWVHLFDNPNASPKALHHFINQIYKKQIINNRDDLCVFVRSAVESSITVFEMHRQGGTGLTHPYASIDALAKLIVMLVSVSPGEGEVPTEKAGYLRMITSLVVLILNHQHISRGERFNQKVFFRFFSRVLGEFNEPTIEMTVSERESIVLTFAEQMLDMRPSYFPGFTFGWLMLIGHREFLPRLMAIPEQAGWAPLADILDHLMYFVGEQLKPLQITDIARATYRGVIKLLIVLQHDFPEFVTANHSRLGAHIPSHCIQLHNLILNASPSTYAPVPDPLQPGLKVDRIEEMRDSPENMNDVEIPLRESGLFDVLEQALRSRPSEDAVAHITRTIQRKSTQSGFAFVPISVDLDLVESLVVYVGMFAIARASQNGSPTFVPNAPDASLFDMLVHELQPEARYFLINSMVSQLRFPNAHTHYFSQALLELFISRDFNDQEELDISQQITRVLLERLLGQWPQPWGLILTVHELVKNEKYKFFDLPFIRSSPDVSERFHALAARPL